MPERSSAILEVIIGLVMGVGLIWQSFQDKVTFGLRSFRAGEEMPNTPFFRIGQRVCGGLLFIAVLWKLRLIMQ
jgi:hypothetical protein